MICCRYSESCLLITTIQSYQLRLLFLQLAHQSQSPSASPRSNSQTLLTTSARLYLSPIPSINPLSQLPKRTGRSQWSRLTGNMASDAIAPSSQFPRTIAINVADQYQGTSHAPMAVLQMPKLPSLNLNSGKPDLRSSTLTTTRPSEERLVL